MLLLRMRLLIEPLRKSRDMQNPHRKSQLPLQQLGRPLRHRNIASNFDYIRVQSALLVVSCGRASNLRW